jgi:hypothetical protein
VRVPAILHDTLLDMEPKYVAAMPAYACVVVGIAVVFLRHLRNARRLAGGDLAKNVVALVVVAVASERGHRPRRLRRRRLQDGAAVRL